MSRGERVPGPYSEGGVPMDLWSCNFLGAGRRHQSRGGRARHAGHFADAADRCPDPATGPLCPASSSATPSRGRPREPNGGRRGRRGRPRTCVSMPSLPDAVLTCLAGGCSVLSSVRHARRVPGRFIDLGEPERDRAGGITAVGVSPCPWRDLRDPRVASRYVPVCGSVGRGARRSHGAQGARFGRQLRRRHGRA
jgi:hypothetical protein